MRNSVSNLDPAAKLPRIKDLEPGQMFRFENSVNDTAHVYMKTDQGVVFLPSGIHYTDHNTERTVVIVKNVGIRA